MKKLVAKIAVPVVQAIVLKVMMDKVNKHFDRKSDQETPNKNSRM